MMDAAGRFRDGDDGVAREPGESYRRRLWSPAVGAVPCPTCEAPVGEPCINSVSGRPYRLGAHITRIVVYTRMEG